MRSHPNKADKLMSRAIFKSNRNQFLNRNQQFKDIALAHMAGDIELLIKTAGRTPVKHGHLKASVHHRKIGLGEYRVEAGNGSELEYAAVQEVGQRLSGKGAPTRPFTNYTTAGTGKGWFKAAVDSVISKRSSYIKEAKKLARL